MPLEVLIAGAGPAGLEAALALRDLAGERVAITLLAPDDELAYRPVSVADPFALAVTRRYPLDAIARDLHLERVVDRLESVDPEAHTVRTAGGRELRYDALLVALGAGAEPALARATTFWGPDDAEAVHGIVQDVEGGYTRRVAFVVPPGITWSLPIYELALLTAARAYESRPRAGAAPDHSGGRAAGDLRDPGVPIARRPPRGGPGSGCTPAPTPSPWGRERSSCGRPASASRSTGSSPCRG